MRGGIPALHLVYQATFLSVCSFIPSMQKYGANAVNRLMVRIHVLEYMCQCLGSALCVRQVNSYLRPGPCASSGAVM